MSFAPISLLGWLFSPTRKIIDLLKRGDQAHAGRALRSWSKGLFVFDVLLAVSLSVLTATKLDLRGPKVIFIPLILFAWSRVNEIVYAFYRDALSRISKEKPTSDLKPIDRIRMAMRSYFGLLVGFSILYYFLPVKDGFTSSFSTYFDSMYFSGITLSTLGYGDIAPKNLVFRLLTLYEVFSGILLAVISIATYLSATAEPEA